MAAILPSLGVLGVVLLAIALFVVTLAVTIFVLTRLPADYFAEARRTRKEKLTVGNVLLRILKNLAGVVILALGIALSLPGIPGPGLLVAFLGFLLADFPGKYRLERKIVSHKRVSRWINGLRTRYGKPPFQLP